MSLTNNLSQHSRRSRAVIYIIFVVISFRWRKNYTQFWLILAAGEKCYYCPKKVLKHKKCKYGKWKPCKKDCDCPKGKMCCNIKCTYKRHVPYSYGRKKQSVYYKKYVCLEPKQGKLLINKVELHYIAIICSAKFWCYTGIWL